MFRKGGRMYFYNPDDREYKEIVAGIQVRTFWGDQLMLAVVDLDPNAILPNHKHPHEQGGIVIKGELTMTIAGETRKLRTGDVYLIPSNIDHSVVVSELPTQLLDIFTPAREDLQY
jgi:unsaturated pyranuronate lyase